MTGRLVVLASGTGTNLGAILDAIAQRRLDAEVVSVIINRKRAGARSLAERFGIPVQYRPLAPYYDTAQFAADGEFNLEKTQSSSTTDGCHSNRESIRLLPTEKTQSSSTTDGWFQDAGRCRYDADLAKAVADTGPDLVVLAGWMHLLSPVFLDRFPNRVINLHPALPGQFPGDSAIADAWAEFKAGQINRTGVMVHYVPDCGIDNGPVIASVEVPMYSDDTFEMLCQRIHKVEHELIVSVIRDFMV